MSKPVHTKIFASDALDELLDVQSKHNSTIWLLSYLDVFVLVVMLMVTLVAISDFNQHPESSKKQEKPNQRIKVHKIIPKITPPTPANPVASKPLPPVTPSEPIAAPSPLPIQQPEVPPAPASAITMQQRLQMEFNDNIKRLGLQEAIHMTVNNEFAQFDIQDGVLFESSAAELTDSGKNLLTRLIPLLKASIGLITIEGHTDNRPIKTSHFYSNWELSAARASSVLHYLTAQQLEPERLRAVSYADTKPIADNTTKAGREKNRRVNIVIQVEKDPPPAAIK